jgi:branched-chain amino acid transport system permease protein
MDQTYGIFLYVISLLTVGGIYAILALGLNIQWGFTGLFNAGIAGFYAIGAYVSAILTTAPTARHLGGYETPYWVAFIAAMLIAGVLAWAVGRICLRLRSDYLAIATIGIAEIFRLILKTRPGRPTARGASRWCRNPSRPCPSRGTIWLSWRWC